MKRRLKLGLATDTLSMELDTWGNYGMASESYLLQDANVPLTIKKKGSILEIVIWAIFWLHLR